MISAEDLSVRAGDFALDHITFRVPTGHYGVLMGRTGCGKTTILETICGLKPATAGKIVLMDRDVTDFKAAERGIGYVPQDAALFSTMTVREHLSFALDIRGANGELLKERVGEMSELLGIGDLLKRTPHGLSGGERQRVALGRALAFHPNVLCLDEPLSSIDDETREEMCDLLKSVQERTGVTALHVTHSMTEANRLADDIFILKDGAVEPADLDNETMGQ